MLQKAKYTSACIFFFLGYAFVGPNSMFPVSSIRASSGGEAPTMQSLGTVLSLGNIMVHDIPK